MLQLHWSERKPVLKELLHHIIQTESPPRSLAGQLHDYACVTVLLRGLETSDLEIGFIQRAINPRDRWSGHIAFPGGRREDSDPDDFHTAIREANEEIGITLQPADLVGRLDDIQAQKHGILLDFFIRPFVFYVESEFPLSLNKDEVADFFWVPLKDLIHPDKQTFFEALREEVPVKLPAIHVDRDPPLWGLTYLIVQNLLKHLKGISL